MPNELILIVEDSRTQQEALKASLTKEGFRIITARDGIEGYNRVITEQPDLIISDINLPELNGYQFCRLLKNDESSSSIPIILLTSLGQMQDRFWGLKAGADRYIVKGTQKEQLLKEINSLLKGKVKVKSQPPLTGHEIKDAAIRARVNDLLDKLLFESTIMGEIKNLTAHINSRTELVEEFFKIISILFDYKAAGFLIVSSSDAVLYLNISDEADMGIDLEAIKEASLKNLSAKRAVEDIKIEIIGNSQTVGEKASIPFSIINRLNIHREVIGNIFMFNDAPYSTRSKNTLSTIAKDLAVIVKLMLLYEENERLSITDGLTKVFNRRYFEAHLEKEFKEAERYNTRLSLIMLDIDHFKSFNDTYGHQQGDAILIQLGKILKKNTRNVDFIVRYGGEEFAILMSGVDKKEGEIAAEKLRKIVEQYPFPGKKKGEHLKVTISLGVSEYDADVMKSYDDLIKYADEALYQAKEEGRNCVRVHK